MQLREQLICLLGLMSLLSMAVLAAPTLGEASIRPFPAKREDDSADDGAPLCGDDGPKLEDAARSGTWDSSWFHAVYGAIAYAKPNAARKLYKDIGSGNGDDGKRTNKATFYVHDLDNKVQSHDVSWKDVPKEADFGPNKRWWIPGSQVAAMKQGCILGADANKISYGSPVDAFWIATGKVAVMEEVTDEQKLVDWAKKAHEVPVVFGLGANPDDEPGFRAWNWYTLTGYLEGSDGDEHKLKYRSADGEDKDRELAVSKAIDDVRKIVYCEGIED